MTTIVPFTPSTAAAFQFQAILDGAPYNAVVTWNVFRSDANANGGFYLNLYAADGTLIVCTALTGSPTGIALESLAWTFGRVIATTAQPHGYKTGRIVTLSLVGSSPDAYNGRFQCLITGPNSFSYALGTAPGAVSALGVVNYDINLIGGIPNEAGIPFVSTIVFRQQAQQFEISP